MVFYALSAVIFVSLLSLLGAVFLLFNRKYLARVVSPLLAISSGVLLGSTFFDLLPESLERAGNSAYALTISGIIAFFSLEKLLQWHHHVEGDHPGKEKAVGYLSLMGDAIHNFIDGVIIGGAFLVSLPIGISVTLAVVAHEIPHELADFTILIHSGFGNRKALLYNFLSATTAILGTLLVLGFSTLKELFIPYFVPFAAGNFLYIAMSDLIPELHRPHTRTASIFQIFAIIFGVLLIALLPRV